MPDLETFEFGPLPELQSFDESSVSLESLCLEPEEEDVWEAAVELSPANQHVAFYTWEHFENAGHVDRHTPYVSESGSDAFDTALAKDDATIPSGRLVPTGLLLESLWSLGLGRSSLLFSFNLKKRTFEPTLANIRPSGLSICAAHNIITQFVHAGNTFLYLKSFVDRTFTSATSISARVAFATAVSTILSTFEHRLSRLSGKIESLLQLQHLFAKPREILTYFARMVDATRHAKSNEQLSSIIHHHVLELEEGDNNILQLSHEILRRVAEPSLELLAEWSGIRPEQQAVPFLERANFVAISDNPDSQGPPEYVMRPEAMPRYISPEDGNTIFETGNSLRFLKLHHPEHPLACLERFAVQSPALEWKFGWEDIESITKKAKTYEEELRAAILKFSRGSASTAAPTPPATQNVLGKSSPIIDFKQYLEESLNLFDAPPNHGLNELPDELQYLMEQILEGTSSPKVTASSTFAPPLSITSTLSFRPLLMAQAKLVNATTLRQFFRSHHIQHHLELQRQYQLLGDGVFSSRLASALFDPERESAERQKGKMRSGVHMGLQLGSRDTWPPASSELRLALMGVLSESYYSSALFYSSQKEAKSDVRRENNELPGQLNFAVRQLTEPEMEKIMDPYGLYALDFLRLQYVPPSPLNLVITTSALDKYDHIFRFLLRLLRMLFVVAHLPRYYSDTESRHFRMEVHHFVTALSSYVFQTGIAEHWDRFSLYISTLERRLAEEDAADQLGVRVTEGLASLRDAHEKCLDSILFSLLLRKRQRKVMALMEEIFELILLFAKKQNSETRVEESVKDLYDKLRGKIKVFLSVCRQLTGKKGYGKGKGTAEENTLERLGVLLEMNGYFAKGT